MATDRTPVLQVRVDEQPQLTIVWCTGKIVIETWVALSTASRKLIPEGKPIRVDLANVDWGRQRRYRRHGQCMGLGKKGGLRIEVSQRQQSWYKT